MIVTIPSNYSDVSFNGQTSMVSIGDGRYLVTGNFSKWCLGISFVDSNSNYSTCGVQINSTNY